MTLEQIKQNELSRIQLEIDRTEDSLINWMGSILTDSINEIEKKTEKNFNLSAELVKELSNRIISNLIFMVDGKCSVDHLNRQIKKLKTLYRDFDYLNS